ncbi:hypothetical protein SLA2020_351020 [Shorea laevis]
MKSPKPAYGRRNPSSGVRSTPDRAPYSPAYSEASTARSSGSSSRSRVAVAANRSPESSSPVSLRRISRALPLASRTPWTSKLLLLHRMVQELVVREDVVQSEGSIPLQITQYMIGQGGFGTVFKGRLEDGTVVAVKRAKKSVYDKHLGVEFQSEIRTLAQVEHLNLVKFYGCLEHGDERIVVVEYVPNGTLREHLDSFHGNVLDLAARLDVAIDVAHAVTYLHMYTDHPIIHRDIKSSNILLTENFRAKVADFGFARLAADSDSGATHVSTQVKGTAGYLDPEYLRTYQLTEKSDVYSFGVLLVELVTGRRPIEPKREMKERITAKWAIKKFTEGDAISILDPKLECSAANHLALEQILELALQCLAPRRQNRPIMRRCAEILWNIRKDYREQSASDLRSLSSFSRSISVREE